LSEENAEETALGEMEILLRELNPYVQGFVWNPFSPNTDALKLLRTERVFTEHAELMKKHASDKLLLVKMGPYEDDSTERSRHLSLVNAFLGGGGHGIVGPNTKMVPKEQVPSEEWGYASAGRSGASLKPYRMRMVRDTLKAFPDAVVFACGGIFDGDDAYETFRAGATTVESYTSETFYGPGLKMQKQRRVLQRLKQDGYEHMQDLQSDVRKGRKLLCDV
jgi:dihydroorotate dehydrogenase